MNEVQKAITFLWIVLAFFIPIYRTLPGNIAGIWTFGALGLIVAIVLLQRAGRPKWAGLWIFAGYAAIAAGLTSSNNSGLSATMPVALQLFVVLCIAPFAVRGSVLKDPKLLPRAATSFVLAQSVSAAAGAAQLFGSPVLGWAQVNERSPGLSGHPNVLGVMSAVAILLLVTRLLKSPKYRLLVTLLLAVNVAGIISSGSLSSMFAGAFGVLVLLYSHGFRVIRIIIVSAAAITAISFVLQIPFIAEYLRNPVQRFYQVTGQTEDISTLGIRVQTFDAAWAYIAQDPFMGKGIDVDNASTRAVGTVVHNLFIRSWYQGGIFLAIAIGAILIAVLVVTLQSLRSKRNGLAVGIMVTLMSYALTAAFFEQAYYWLPVLAAWASLDRTPVRSSEVRKEAVPDRTLVRARRRR